MQKINGAPGAAAGNAVNEVRKVMKRLVVGVLAHVDSGKTTLRSEEHTSELQSHA